MTEPLGSIRRTVSPDEAQEALKASRLRRWKRKDTAGKLLPKESVCWCCKRVIPVGEKSRPSDTMQFHTNGETWGLRGVMRCGSVWSCPICAARITEVRRVELEAATRPGNYTLLMVSVTLQHERGDLLTVLLEALKDSWRRTKQGKAWQNLSARFDLAGSITATEVTYSQAAGWHPHLHVLFFSRLPADQFSQDDFKAQLTARYTTILAKHGRYASDLYGLHVRFGDGGAAKYASKFGLEAELTKSTVKNGREGGLSPWQLLDLYADGAAWAGLAFKEYAAAFKGKKQLTWSPGLRDLLAVGPELTDEEAAEAEPEPEAEAEPETVVTLTREQYGKIAREGGIAISEAGEKLVEMRLDVFEYFNWLYFRFGIRPEPANFT